MKKLFHKLYPILVFLALAFYVVLFFEGCNPQKKLNNLVANHPDLAHTDTTMQDLPVTVPGFVKDTSAPASHDIEALYSIIDGYADLLDSLSRLHIKQELHTYVINRNCLDSPLTIPFPGGGFFRIYQQGGKFFYHLEQPPRKFNVRVPLVIMKVETVTKSNWPWFCSGFFVALLFFTVLIFLLAKLH